MEFAFKRCFVITPYGLRTHAEGDKAFELDFEFVYKEIVAKALDGIVPHTHRSKDRTFSGVVHEDMFRQIISADVVVCDITMLNPNVLYELGVRHAARPSGTIIIQQGAGSLPFNLRLVRVVRYDAPLRDGATAATADKADHLEKVEAAREQLRKYVRESLSTRKIDSPVHALIPNLNLIAPPRPLETVAVGLFPVQAAEEEAQARRKRQREATAKEGETTDADATDQQSTKLPAAEPSSRVKRRTGGAAEIGIATGNLRDLYDVADVWVNPENTRMEMGPLFGESVSSYIRVLGSAGRDDTLGRDDVQSMLRRAMQGRPTVMPGKAISTGAGKLEQTHGVRRIVHIAAQEGFPLGGFRTVPQVGGCVVSALEEIERLNRSKWTLLWRQRPLKSVLIPLFGTRNPGLDPVDVAKEIVLAARRHLDQEQDSSISRILFLASTDQDYELCEIAFRRLGYPLKNIRWETLSFGELDPEESRE